MNPVARALGLAALCLSLLSTIDPRGARLSGVGRCEAQPRSRRAELRPLVVTGVTRQGRMDEAALRMVAGRLERLGQPFQVARPALTVKRLECLSQECLTELANQQRAAQLLGASIEDLDAQTSKVTVWLFTPGQAQPHREEYGRCEGGCDVGKLEQVLRDTVAAVFEAPRHAALGAEARPAASDSLAGPAPRSLREEARVAPAPGRGAAERPRRRLAAVAVLSTLLTVAAVTAISLTATTEAGNPLCVKRDQKTYYCTDENRGLTYGLTYGATGALGLGLVLTLALP